MAPRERWCTVHDPVTVLFAAAASDLRRPARMEGNRMNDALALLISLVIAFAAAGLGTLANIRSLREWYPSLPKPRWTPPSWLFGPVWSLLYMAMAFAAWLVWRESETHDVGIALAWYVAQLVLNVAWSVVFFGRHATGAGLVVIIGLWWAIAATIAAFLPISPLAAWLLVPYLVWVTFATALNASIAALVERAAKG